MYVPEELNEENIYKAWKTDESHHHRRLEIDLE